MRHLLYATGFVVLSAHALSTTEDSSIGKVGSVTSQSVIQKLDSGSELVALQTDPLYQQPIYVLSLHGDSSFQQGYDAGVLFGKQWDENYKNLFNGFFGDYPKMEPVLMGLTEAFMDWQWEDYLSVQVPVEYMDEIAGLEAGALSIGVKDVGKQATRGIALANLPGDGEDIFYVLIDEFTSKRMSALTAEQLKLIPAMKEMFSTLGGHQCSMFGAWGDRTVDGNFLAARNLDWVPDLGVNQYKLITVHHPPNGTAHATIGFGGVWGALAGMSSKGITVHEANLESKQDTFRGFPWLLRLRYVMSYAATIDEGLALWADTNNTVGFNHMIGSASEHRAVAMETMKGYTAYFESMDDRENGAVDPSTGDVYGYPLPNALYRTNHGYDPVTQENYQWYGYHAYEDSKNRYNAIYNYFKTYEEEGVSVGTTEAVRITSAVGIKGDGSSEETCDPTLYSEGLNILSVTYDPAHSTLFAAFDDGTGDSWIPAACNGYIKIDMSQWF